MARIPSVVLGKELPLRLLGRGKVRDTYELPDHPDRLLVVASNRVSIFDFVLAALVLFKGEILTALNVFWRRQVLKGLCHHDLIAAGSEIDDFLPEALRGDSELHRCAVVVHQLLMADVEGIVRGYLTGSSVPAYLETGMVCGHRLQPGLIDGSRLLFPIFTPTTKAEVGHDEHITADSVGARFGVGLERLALQLYQVGASYAAERGIILCDTKFEFSRIGALADEVLTPDSSRYWDALAWQRAHTERKLPPSFDKQFVRDWGKGHGVHKRNPEVEEDIQFVHGLSVPDDVRKNTTALYRYIFWRLTGSKLEEYQASAMGIAVHAIPVRVDVVIGSRSDAEQTAAGLEFLSRQPNVTVRQHVISCHRNPSELATYAASVGNEADAIIAGAGMAAALPGVLKALLSSGGVSLPVLGVAFSGKSASDDAAARLSIENLPGQPVELNSNGRAYFGEGGFHEACMAAIQHEFLPKTISAKPAELCTTFV